jgi:hypothetical protein
MASDFSAEFQPLCPLLEKRRTWQFWSTPLQQYFD